MVDAIKSTITTMTGSGRSQIMMVKNNLDSNRDTLPYRRRGATLVSDNILVTYYVLVDFDNPRVAIPRNADYSDLVFINVPKENIIRPSDNADLVLIKLPQPASSYSSVVAPAEISSVRPTVGTTLTLYGNSTKDLQDSYFRVAHPRIIGTPKDWDFSLQLISDAPNVSGYGLFDDSGKLVGAQMGGTNEWMGMLDLTGKYRDWINEVIRTNGNPSYNHRDTNKPLTKPDNPGNNQGNNSGRQTNSGLFNPDLHKSFSSKFGSKDGVLDDSGEQQTPADYSVRYTGATNEHSTETGFDLPDVNLQMSELPKHDPVAESVVGSFSKEEDHYGKRSTYNPKKPNEEKSLYDKLFPDKKIVDYLDIPVKKNLLQTVIDEVSKLDPRYGLMMQEIHTVKDLLQWCVDFRWTRFNLLDRYISFTDYAKLVIDTLKNVSVPSDFPVLVTGNTVTHGDTTVKADSPYSVDYKNRSISTTTWEHIATMKVPGSDTTVTTQSLDLINHTCNWSGTDYLVVNNGTRLYFKSTTGEKVFKLPYSIMRVTGIQYVDKYLAVHLISNYTERTIIFNEAFELKEDTVSELFPGEITKFLDPKTKIFRDRYQYYVNSDTGSTFVFPLVDMFDINNNLVKKFTLVESTLDNPMPVSIVAGGPRINAKYGEQYRLMWSYNTNVSLMTLYPVMGYTFTKNSFYNPRKYLTNKDYNEACLPLHGNFRNTRIYPWFLGRPGFIWSNGFLYTKGLGYTWGMYDMYWDLFWWGNW